MRGAATWGAGLVVSGVVHVAVALYLVVFVLVPEPPETQPSPRSELRMDTVNAPLQDAIAQEPEAEDAQSAEGSSTQVGAQAVRQSDAKPVAAPSEALRPAEAQASQLQEQTEAAVIDVAETRPDPKVAKAVTGSSERLAESTTWASVAKALETQSNPAASVAVNPARIETERPDSDSVAVSQTPEATRISAAQSNAATAQGLAPDGTAVTSVQADAVKAAEAVVTDVAARPGAVTPDAAKAVQPNLPKTKAVEAVSQGDVVLATVATPEVSTPVAPVSVPVSSATPSASTAASVVAKSEAALSAEISPEAAPEATATASVAPQLAALGDPSPQVSGNPLTPSPQELPATSATASLAWQFGDRLVTDPQALKTIQAFMTPDSLDDADTVKDGLSSVLTSVDCARLSATFVPEDGVLEMRGHVPDPSLQAPLLTALQEQMGEGIPVRANLLHLPSPQCGALTGIANVGLPQSTDQFTNSRLIGESSHARAYTYAEGQRLQFDLTAPDYDAFVYVDYFSADGEVIHLVPNETISLEKFAAEAVVGVGADRPGKPGLRITIGPPFGQEIAVAFASSVSLYEGLRPIVEPAEPYLEFLKSRVAEAREKDPEFKGEWVYFFITTTPATQ